MSIEVEIQKAIRIAVREAVDEAMTDSIEDKIRDKVDEATSDELPSKSDVRALVKKLGEHNYSEMCDQVDNLHSRLAELEKAGTFQEGHKQIIIGVVRSELVNLGVAQDQNIMINLLIEIRDLLKNK